MTRDKKKKQYPLKEKNCKEIRSCFDLPFAVKEFVQNIQGQILKNLRTRDWDEWKKIDLTDASTAERLAAKKDHLFYTQTGTKPKMGDPIFGHFASLCKGPDGACLRSDTYEPLYILSARIPADRIKAAELRERQERSLDGQPLAEAS